MKLSDFLREIRERATTAAPSPEAIVAQITERLETELREQRALGEQGDAASLAARIAENQPALSELATIRAEMKAEIASIERQKIANRARLNGGSPTDEATEARSVFPSMREYNEARAQTVGSDPGGGYLVPTEMGTQFYDRLRPSNVVLQAKPRVVSFDADSIKLPKLGSSVTVVNAGEGGTIADSDAAFEQLQLTARKYAARTIGTNEWFADSAAGLNARGILEQDHRSQLAAALDRDFLQGNGINKILGMRNWPAITNTVLGAGNGLAPTLDNVADAIDRLERADAKATAIFMHPRTWATLRKLKDLQDRYQLQPDPTADSRRQLFGVPVFVTSQISITETVGASNDCSYILVADMSRVVIGRRQDINVLYDPYTLSSTGKVVINTWTRWALGVLDDEAIELISGVRA